MSKSLKDVYVGVDKSDPKRNKNDLYPTPPLATYILCKYSNVPKNVVEPCAGKGNISIELQRNGHNVRSFDAFGYDNSLTTICIGQDVMELDKQTGFDGFVTNPPYFNDLPRKITEKVLSEYSYVAMFLRLTFLEGIKRHKLLKNNPPTQLIIFSDRVRFGDFKDEPIAKDDQINGMISYAWFIWDQREINKKDTKLDWIMLRDEYDEWHQNYIRTIK